MTSTTWATDQRPAFSIGAAVSTTLSTLAATAGPLTVAALPFVVAPQALAGLLPDEIHGVGVVAGLPSLIFQGAAIRIAYGHLTGQPMSLGDALRAGMQRFGALWGSGILGNLGIGLGLLLLIGPGVFLAACWMVYQPVLMIEGTTATGALDRSWTMTKGVRWPMAAMVGLAAVALLVLLVVTIAVGVGFVVGIGGAPGKMIENVLLLPVFEAAFATICCVGSTAVYVQLKRAVDGALHGEIAEIFN